VLPLDAESALLIALSKQGSSPPLCRDMLKPSLSYAAEKPCLLEPKASGSPCEFLVRWPVRMLSRDWPDQELLVCRPKKADPIVGSVSSVGPVPRSDLSMRSKNVD